jgi:hypothetical protein
MGFILEAIKLLHHNTSCECLCVPIAHRMWSTYKTKESNNQLPQVSVTVNPKDFIELKPPTCPSHWILCEHTKNIIAYPSIEVKSIDILAKRALSQIYKTSVNVIPTDFEYILVAAINNPVTAINNANTYKSSKVTLE